MEAYNKMDVLSLEELYNKLQPWAKEANFMHLKDEIECACGSQKFEKKGKRNTLTGIFQRYKCKGCGANYQGKINIAPKNYSKTLLKKV